MRKQSPPKDFEIHVDPSCLSELSDNENEMPNERATSSETIVHHDLYEDTANPTDQEIESMEPEEIDDEEDDDKENTALQKIIEETRLRERQMERLEAEIKAAARQVVASIEKDDFGGPDDSLLSIRTEESYEPEEIEPEVEQEEAEQKVEQEEAEQEEAEQEEAEQEEAEQEEAEQKVEQEEAEQKVEQGEVEQKEVEPEEVEEEEADHKEVEQEGVKQEEVEREQVKPEEFNEFDGQDDTELRYEDEPEAIFESDHEHDQEGAGDSSSQHDGDIDDVFSQSDRSKRSSLNSVLDLQSADESADKLLTSPAVGEEAASFHDSENEAVSRIPSGASYIKTPADSTPRTPSKNIRPPFRTPSSVRAMQMSSPTPSIFSSPRSVKRSMPTVSRLGTPTSIYSPSKRTPTRLKPRKDPPLVLLHVTVLPLQWPYSHLMSALEVPESLYNVKESWRLLQDKVGDTVLERGILLPHPQDSYDVLEERLLEALELPVRPRAIILKCGHYMGPMDSDAASSDDEACDVLAPLRRPDGSFEERKWCDICGRDVRLEEVGEVDQGEKRFRIKVYASNGLMRAGAWEACWKEMERIDVEIQPYVDQALQPELEQLLLTPQNIQIAEQQIQQLEEIDDGFEDEEVAVEHVHNHEHQKSEEEMKLEEEIRQHVEKEEERKRAEENESRRQSEEEQVLRRKMLEDNRMREIYGSPTPEPERRESERRESERREFERRTPEPRSSSRATIDEHSLSELLIAAFKVIMQDTRNVMIGLLGVLVLLLILVPRGASQNSLPSAIMEAPVPQITTITTTTATIEAPLQPPVTRTVIQELTMTERVTIPTTVEVVVESVSTEYLTVTELSSVETEVIQSTQETTISSTQEFSATIQDSSMPTPEPLIAAEKPSTSTEEAPISTAEALISAPESSVMAEESSTSTPESSFAAEESSASTEEPGVTSSTIDELPIVPTPTSVEAEATPTTIVEPAIAPLSTSLEPETASTTVIDPCIAKTSTSLEPEATSTTIVEDVAIAPTSLLSPEPEATSVTIVESSTDPTSVAPEPSTSSAHNEL